VTASAEVTPQATLRARVMQERLKLFTSFWDSSVCWHPKPSLSGGCVGYSSHMAQKTVEWRRPQAGTKSLPQRSSCVRLCCGMVWMLPVEQKMPRSAAHKPVVKS